MRLKTITHDVQEFNEIGIIPVLLQPTEDEISSAIEVRYSAAKGGTRSLCLSPTLSHSNNRTTTNSPTHSHSTLTHILKHFHTCTLTRRLTLTLLQTHCSSPLVLPPQGDIARVGASIMLIFVYVVLQLGDCTRVGGRMVLAVGGLATVGLALGVSYGLGSLASVFTPVHSVLPFLIVGIGVDDMFVIVNEFDLARKRHSSKNKGGGQREVALILSEAMREAGSSITVTSLTDFLVRGWSGAAAGGVP